MNRNLLKVLTSVILGLLSSFMGNFIFSTEKLQVEGHKFNNWGV